MTNPVANQGFSGAPVRLPPGLWRDFLRRWRPITRLRDSPQPGGHLRPGPGDFDGLDLAGVRPWQAGDSPRRISARTTARLGHPMVRVDTPSWRLPFMLVLDRSVGMLPSAPAGSPARVAVGLVGAITAAVAAHGDPVGMALLGSQVEAVLSPRSGSARAVCTRRASRPLPDAEKPMQPGRLGALLETLPRRIRCAAAWVVLTDGLDETLPAGLAKLAARAPVWLVLLERPLPTSAERALGFEELQTGLTGPPLGESGWCEIAQYQESARAACVEILRRRLQPVTRLQLDQNLQVMLASGRWLGRPDFTPQVL